MLAFPVAKLEDVGRLYQEVRRPPISSAVSGLIIPVISKQYLGCSLRTPVSDFRSAELNRQIRELKRPVTYRKHTLASELNRQKMQKCSRAFSVLIVASEARGFVHSHQGSR